MGSSEINFELGPCFVGDGLSLPVATVVRKNACLENYLVGNGEDLGRGVGGVAGLGVVYGIFVLFEEVLDGQVYVVARFHMGIVGLHFIGCDIGVCLIQMGEFVKGCAGCKTDKGKTEGLKINWINRSDHECRDSLLHI